jgi:uncharacterized protein YjlB
MDPMATDKARLVERLWTEGWRPTPWSNGPGDQYEAHEHAYDKVLVVAAGSVRFGLPGVGTTVELGVGDRLDLPAGTSHDAIVGPAGVTCLEAHCPAGTFQGPERRSAGDW